MLLKDKLLTTLGTIGLLLLTPNAFATTQVVQYFTHTPVSVCQPSDTNTKCGGSGGGGSANPGGVQGDIQFFDTQGTLTVFGGNSGLFYSGVGSTSGNIGIGSIHPGQILDVQGTIRSLQIMDSGLTASKAAFTDANKQLTSTGIGTSSQFIKGDGSLDSSTYLTANQTITLTGDVTGSGNGSFATTLKNTGTSGTYRSTTFDAQGRETSGTNPTTFSGYGLSDSSANLRAALTDSTGTGVTVFATAPNFTANVGVGSVNPGQALDVQGTIRASGDLIDTNVKSAVLKTDSNGKIVATSSLTDTAYSTAVGANPTATVGTSAVNGSSANFMRADGAPAISLTMSPTWTGNHTFSPSSGNTLFSSGNVGVGSATPGVILDVQGTVRALGIALPGGAQGQVIMQNGVGIGTWSTVSGGGGSGTVNSGTTNQIAYYASSTTAVSGSSALIVTGASSGNNIGIGSATPGAVLDVQGTIRDFGNIGIGTASPGFSLDVNGGGRFLGTGNTSLNPTSGNVGIGTPSPTGFEVEGLNVGIGTSSNGSNGAKVIIFGGNVGIGTVSPGVALDVKGDIRDNDFSGQASGTIMCVKTGGAIGYCSGSIVGVGCTCN